VTAEPTHGAGSQWPEEEEPECEPAEGTWDVVAVAEKVLPLEVACVEVASVTWL